MGKAPLGEALSGFDLIVAMSPASQRAALDLTRYYHLTVEYWPVMDPTGLGESREMKLNAYRQTRDQIIARMDARFGRVRGAGQGSQTGQGAGKGTGVGQGAAGTQGKDSTD